MKNLHRANDMTRVSKKKKQYNLYFYMNRSLSTTLVTGLPYKDIVKQQHPGIACGNLLCSWIVYGIVCGDWRSCHDTTICRSGSGSSWLESSELILRVNLINFCVAHRLRIRHTETVSWPHWLAILSPRNPGSNQMLIPR